ncbi:MAG: cupin domain-containing protein [Lachnospirales bacterium]
MYNKTLFTSFRPPNNSNNHHNSNHNDHHNDDHHNNNNNNNNNDNDDYIKDYGKEPLVIDIEKVTKANNAFRRALWTGDKLQITLMSIKTDIGLEMHRNTDQFLKVEEGFGTVVMGKNRNNLNKKYNIQKDTAIVIPAGTWHNIYSNGKTPLKLYSIYAPPQHKKGTLQWTKKDSQR